MSGSRSSNLKYQVYRSTALTMAKEFILDNPTELLAKGIDPACIRFEPITQEALNQSYLWISEAQLYPWEDVPSWKKRDTRYFDLSLWYDHELCGLCYATPRASTLTIKIVLLEGKPDGTHPLKGQVAGLALINVTRYGRMLGLSEIEIQDPDPGAIDWYKELGFELDDEQRLVISIVKA